MRFAKAAATVDVIANFASVEFGSAAVSHVVNGRTARDLLPAEWPGLDQIAPP